MRKETTNLVVQILKDYPLIDKKIAARKYEIEHPFHEQDDNIGGGKAQNRPWTYYDNLIITIDQDRELRRLKAEKEVIEEVYDQAGETIQKIIKECYFSPHHRSIKNLVATNAIWCSQTKAYKLRDGFIKDVARALNIDTLWGGL